MEVAASFMNVRRFNCLDLGVVFICDVNRFDAGRSFSLVEIKPWVNLATILLLPPGIVQHAIEGEQIPD